MSSDKTTGIDRLVDLLHQTEHSISVTNDIERRHYGPITGIISAVDDPQSKGRVKVKLDAFKQEYVTEEWMPVVGAHIGNQPRQLIGAKCLIAPIEGSVHLYRVIGIIDGDIGTFDPITDQGEFDHHTDSSNYEELANLKPMSVRTGVMHRLPVYSIPARDVLPRCHAGNHGVKLIVDDGLNSFELTCLRVKGGFGWNTYVRKKYDGNFGGL
jgi:hypothetical protein